VENLEHEIRDFVVQNYCFNGVQISDQQSLMDTGIIDSTGVLELVSFVEMQYSIQVRSDELVPDNFDSIHRVTRFVVKKLRENAPTAV
jgi:acyl carrier protein